MNSSPKNSSKSVFDYHINNVRFDDTYITAQFKGGEEAKMPLAWFPKLAIASKKELEGYQIVGNGYALYWESLDEDLLAEGFFTYSS